MNQWKSAIKAWFADREAQLIAQLAALVAVPSVGSESTGPGKPFGEGPAKALEVALAQAQAAGLRGENQDGYVLTVDLNDCPDELHILAHLDVVAPGEGWDSDPYTLLQEGDMVYGRGVDDDKGPAVAAMMALECVKALEIPLRRNVKLILGTDEESGSRDIAHYYATVPYAPCAFSPDAVFPVINIEKGQYTPMISASWAPQPEVPQVTSLTGGSRINVVPRQAEALIEKLSSCETTTLAVATGWVTGTVMEVTETENGVRITCTGQDAHASTPQEGTNAITALLYLLNQLPLADTASARAIAALAQMFPHKDHHGKALGIDMADEASGRITVCPSLIELNRQGMRCQFDARVPLCATRENCSDVVQAVCRDHGFTAEGEMRPGHQVAEESRFVQTLLRCYEEETGQQGECVAIGGGTYVHNIPGGVAFGAGNAEFDSRLHGANERARVSNLLLAGRIYANVIVELCGEGFDE